MSTLASRMAWSSPATQKTMEVRRGFIQKKRQQTLIRQKPRKDLSIRTMLSTQSLWRIYDERWCSFCEKIGCQAELISICVLFKSSQWHRGRDKDNGRERDREKFKFALKTQTRWPLESCLRKTLHCAKRWNGKTFLADEREKKQFGEPFGHSVFMTTHFADWSFPLATLIILAIQQK